MSNEVNIGNDDVALTRLKGKVTCYDSTNIYTEVGAFKDSNYLTIRAWNDANNKTELLSPTNLNVIVNDGDFKVLTGSAKKTAISADVNQHITIPERLYLPNPVDSGSTPANMFINSEGLVCKSTAISYSTEEVDKKLAIKDKLIEKLSARLDALEKKVK